MAFRRNYWSCSKFADWIRGTAKPSAETSKGWNNWNKDAKKSYPIRYWIAEEGLEIIQDTLYFIPDKFYSVRSFLRNKYSDKTHTLTSTLKQGKWYDLDTRILYCLFDELVKYVEDEKARMNYEWFEKNNVKKHYPCAKAGLAYLDWEMSLKHDEEWVKKTDPNYGKPTHQALVAKEILELYNWWKNVYPNRPDAMDESGWSAHCEKRRKKYGEDILGLPEDETKKEREETKKILDKNIEIENQYDLEEEQMLMRLIKIRKSLWT